MTAATPFSRRTILASAGALLSGAAIARLLTALAVILLARQIGPGQYGQYAAALTLTRVTSVLFSLGLDTWLLRAGARARDRDDLSQAAGSNLAIKSGLGLLWMIGLVLVAPRISPQLFPVGVIAPCALIVWFDELAMSSWSTFQSRLNNRTVSALMVVSSGLVLGSTVALVLVGSKALEPYLVVRTVAAVAGAGLSVYWLISRIGIRIDRAMLLPTLRATLPFALSAALAVIYGSVDIPLTALLLGEQAAGYYAPASTLVMTLYLIPASLYGVMLPVLSAAYSENRDRFVALGRRFTLFGVLLGLAMGMSLFMMARPLVLGLFGAEYAPSIPLLRLLSLVLAMHCVSFASAAFLTAADRQTWRLMAQAVAAAANIALNLFLIPRWGLVGVAWAFVFSEVLLVGGYLLAMWIADRRLREVVALTPFAGQS